MAEKPTIVLVPGAWHLASTWDKVTALLEPDYKCVSITLPSTNGSPDTTFKQDIDAVRGPIIAENKQGRDVVVVVHSYGGAVGASAIKGLTRPNPGNSSENSKSGHVIGLVLLGTGFVVTGVSFLDGAGGVPPPSWRLDESGFATLVAEPRELFYQDLPEEEGKYWVSKLQKQAQKVLTDGGEHMYSGWKDVPVWYGITLKDNAFGPAALEVQTMLAQMAKDAGADVTVREFDSGHSPMLSKPKETAEFILEAAKAFVL